MPAISLPAAFTKAVKRQTSMSPSREKDASMKNELSGAKPRPSLDRDPRRSSILHLSGRTSSTTSLDSKKIAKLECVIESPPLLMHGSPLESTGALLSGRLNLVVKESEKVTVTGLALRLVAETEYKKPVSTHCPDCAKKTSNIKEWRLIGENAVLGGGDHVYPFSHLLSGNLPQTTKTQLGSIKYYLSASGLLTNGEELHLTTPIIISRAFYPRPEKTSIRIFPPTKLSATVVLPSLMYAVGPAPVQLFISGLVDPSTKTRWRLRKLLWRIDETVKAVSPACEAHSKKLGGENKGLLHEDVRTVGYSELKSGWKTDFGFLDNTVMAPDGTLAPTIGRVEFEFEVQPRAGHQLSNNLTSPCGMNVTHSLVLELIVVEENIPSPRMPRLAVQTGSARVLRMQFDVQYSDRPGLGISWDEEQPPMYEDVPPSPPTYKTEILEYDGPAFDLDEVPDYEEGEVGQEMRLEELRVSQDMMRPRHFLYSSNGEGSSSSAR
jgi:hypothetical protein